MQILSDKERKAKERARKRKNGLRPREVWVYEEDIPKLKEVEMALRDGLTVTIEER